MIAVVLYKHDHVHMHMCATASLLLYTVAVLKQLLLLL
jgi:hypothetical protein